MKTILFAVAALAVAPAAWANDEAPKKDDIAQVDQEGEKNDPTRMICKREKLIGSRLGTKKTCATAAEWAQMRSDNRQTTERVQANRPRVGN